MDLIIDGNYILKKNVFTLNREKLLYGLLFDVLEKNINKFKSWYSFDNIYFVSDYKKSWRIKIKDDYKKRIKKDDNIDWEFVFVTFSEFKDSLKNNPKTYVLEESFIEGDDWIKYLIDKNKKLNKSSLIISSDKDLTQLLETQGNFINFMLTDTNRLNKFFLPDGYKTWLYNYKKTFSNISQDDLLFEDQVTDQLRMVNFIEKMIENNDPIEINNKEVLFKKIIGGDRGDNIPNVYKGLGEKTTDKVFNCYFEYFGEPDFSKDCFNKTTDIIIDLKKLESDKYDEIRNNISLNEKLINLDKIPKKINEKMNEKFYESL